MPHSKSSASNPLFDAVRFRIKYDSDGGQEFIEQKIRQWTDKSHPIPEGGWHAEALPILQRLVRVRWANRQPEESDYWWGIKPSWGTKVELYGYSAMSASDWTKEDAEKAAAYNSERWGPWEVVPPKFDRPVV